MSHDSPTSAAALSFWLERQRYDRVIEEGRRLLAQSPEDPDLHRMMAVAHWMLDDRRSAEHHLRQTLRLRPDDESSLSLLALMSSTSMGSRKSDKHAIQALALDPDSVTAWHALASSSLGDDPEFSMRCSRRMLEIDPHNISARILMFAATAIDESVPGWHQQAERWLQEALTIEPENADVHALLGDHLLSVPQRRKEGEAHLRHAIASDPMSAQASAWRRSLASKRDFFLKLLVLPRKICTGIITAMGRSISRYPLLILLGKFYLIAFVFCLMALIFWGIFLWPIVWLYRHYVVQGDHLRASLMLSGKRWLGWLVPAPAWLRRIIMLFPLLAWWRLVPEIIGGIGSLHPGLHSGNVVAIGATVLLLGCAGLYCWLEFRASRRRKEMAGFPPTASHPTSMDLPDAIEHFLSKPGAEETTPFGPDVLVYKVAGKMFGLAVPEDFPSRINLKCDPERAVLLRDEHSAILPGYHMNKRHWNTVVLDGSLPSSLVRELIDHSYDLVVAGLPKAERAKLGS